MEFFLMEDGFAAAWLTGEARPLFDHPAAQAAFGASVFWLRRLVALEGEVATIERWRVKRDGSPGRVIEILLCLRGSSGGAACGASV